MWNDLRPDCFFFIIGKDSSSSYRHCDSRESSAAGGKAIRSCTKLVKSLQMYLHPALLHSRFCSVVPIAFSFWSSDNIWLSSVGARMDLAWVTSHSHSFFKFKIIVCFHLYLYPVGLCHLIHVTLPNEIMKCFQTMNSETSVKDMFRCQCFSYWFLSVWSPGTSSHTVSSACLQQKRSCIANAL